jgi:Protein of unknown function DUF262
VIDGQQRLTTLSILLCVVRDVASAHGWNELAAEVDENYLVHRFKKGRERFKVFPRMRDRSGYLALVDRTESTAGGQIEAAHRLFTKRVEQLATSEPELRRFFTALVTRLDFVAITLGAENPYKIFRSLNSTGVDLTEADLIRNHVFMSMPIDDQDAFDDTLWRDLESRFVRDGKLSGRDIEAFLRDALMRDGTYVGRDGTFEAFERRFPNGKFDPRTVVADLTKVSKLYDVVRGATAHADAEIEGALRTIRELNVTTGARRREEGGAMKIIGATTTYVGSEIPGFNGQRVRIFGVMRGALRRDVNVDADDYFLTDDEVLARLGGVTKLDRLDVAYVRADGSASFVHCDPRAIDLECFADLKD